ncbi:MAG: hypothetical protein EKK53_21540 [Burkholderiales bacterium]|nr:MAG: hypothetical protein EKK53_21540 [Burkholderiales bacterium]
MNHELRPNDFRSETWKRLTNALEAELERLRESNDAQSLGVTDTAVIRGQIKAVKNILALGQQPSASDRSRPENFPVGTLVELQELGLDPLN